MKNVLQFFFVIKSFGHKLNLYNQNFQLSPSYYSSVTSSLLTFNLVTNFYSIIQNSDSFCWMSRSEAIFMNLLWILFFFQILFQGKGTYEFLKSSCEKKCQWKLSFLECLYFFEMKNKWIIRPRTQLLNFIIGINKYAFRAWHLSDNSQHIKTELLCMILVTIFYFQGKIELLLFWFKIPQKNDHASQMLFCISLSPSLSRIYFAIDFNYLSSTSIKFYINFI